MEDTGQTARRTRILGCVWRRKRLLAILFGILACYCGSYAVLVYRAMQDPSSMSLTIPENLNDGKEGILYVYVFPESALYFYWPLIRHDAAYNGRMAVSESEHNNLAKTKKTFEMLRIMAEENAKLAGTWEDDPQNWKRAFGVDVPADITVIHSKYWKSDHWTDEYMYFFTIKASAQWQDDYMKQHGLVAVPPEKAQTYRSGHHNNLCPAWFVPGEVQAYDVYDRPEYRGSLWIEKKTGYISFMKSHL